nr:unnamed protein product [Leishmania braziliensis]
MTYPQLAAQVARRSLQRQWQPEISVWVLLAFTVLALFVSVATASPPLLNTQSPAVLQKEEELLDCTEHEAIPFYTAEQQANTLAFLAEFPYAIPALSNTWMCHNFCKWNGVHCSEEGVEVSLHSRLIGRLPEVPAAVDPDHIMVTSIVLKGRGDGIESTLPESWLHLTKLTTLQLNLENKPPVSTSLKIQNVAYKMQPMNTAASSVNTKACFLPRNVVNVSITRNSISGRLPPRFPLCNPKMQYLYLQYNPDIYGPIPKEWGKWTSLQILNIKGTRVCGCAPPEWGNFNPPVTLLAEDLVTHPEICNTSCPDISTSSSSAPSSSSSSAPSSSSSALECDGPIPFYSESQQVNTRSFLEAFKDTIEDLQPLWTCTNFCVWPYVLCTPAGVAVEITGTEFFGHVPEVSPDVDTAEVVVTKLDFSHSMWVEGDYPASWASLHSLEHVSFAYTAMSGTLPSEWGDMDALRYLDLSFTWTNGMFPQSWSRLAKLEVLNLMHLTIPDHPPDSWSHMTALRELNLASTRASGTLPASWSSLKNLEILSLSNNTMFGSLPEQWGSLKQLATLMLHENYLSGSIPEIYNDMTALTRASLENNRFCGCLPSVWAAQQGVSMTITAQKEVLASDCATANTCDPEAVSSSSSAPSSSSSAPSSSSSAPSSSSSSAPSSSSSAPSSSSSSAPSSSSSAPSSSSSSAPSSSSSAPSSSSSAPSSSSSAPSSSSSSAPSSSSSAPSSSSSPAPSSSSSAPSSSSSSAPSSSSSAPSSSSSPAPSSSSSAPSSSSSSAPSSSSSAPSSSSSPAPSSSSSAPSSSSSPAPSSSSSALSSSSSPAPSSSSSAPSSSSSPAPSSSSSAPSSSSSSAPSSSSSAPSSSSSPAPSSSSSALSSSSSSAPSSSSSAPSSSSSSAPSSSSSAPSSSSSAPSSSSSAPSSSSSSAPSSSSSAPTTTEEPTPDPVLPSSASSSVDRTFYDALYFYCPNVEEAGVETIQAHKEEICCNAWDGADYSVTCGDEIRGFSNAIVTCSGAIGSRGYFSCCSRVGRDGTATFLGERCEDKPVDGVDSHEALAPWWNPRTSGGGLLVTLLAVIVVCVL